MLLRPLAMPADTNANGDIFGGWIMSQLDLAGGILAKEISGGRNSNVTAIQLDGLLGVQKEGTRKSANAR